MILHSGFILSVFFLVDQSTINQCVPFRPSSTPYLPTPRYPSLINLFANHHLTIHRYPLWSSPFRPVHFLRADEHLINQRFPFGTSSPGYSILPRSIFLRRSFPLCRTIFPFSIDNWLRNLSSPDNHDIWFFN